jgi:hypothetical protein
MRKQEVFDICMVILLFAIVVAAVGWHAAATTDKPCKYVSPYANTLQRDIHRKMECRDAK